MTSNIGTVAWAAPEIFAGDAPTASYSLAADAYSFGASPLFPP
jgi:serine/threonine protein kinase